jgi:glycerophosphoryl diester phosphodiesterase
MGACCGRRAGTQFFFEAHHSPAPMLCFPLAGKHLLRQRDAVKKQPWSDWKKLLIPITLALVMTGQSARAAEELPALKLLNAKRTLIIGHRGYPQFAPENTLPGFKLAIDAGADLVELDYYHSKDGVPIVFHDATLDRTSDAVKRWGGSKIKVESKTAAELLSLDAGAWFSAKYKGTKLPSLTESVDFIQTNNGITLIERKEGDAAACVEMVRGKGLVNRLVVQAFDWHYLKQYRDLEPDQVLGALGPPKLLADGSKPPSDRPKTLNKAWLDDLVKTGANAVVWSDQITKESVKDAHKRKLKVWVYTINDPVLANKLLDMGVDGIITNNTGLLWRTLALRAMK